MEVFERPLAGSGLRARSFGTRALQEVGLVPAAVREPPQVPQVGAEPRVSAARRQRRVVSTVRSRLEGRLEQSVLDELAPLRAADSRALAQLRPGRSRLLGGEPGAAAPLALLRGRRGELLADHAQRQELVALEPQDRLEPLDVLLAEQAVPTARALWRSRPWSSR